MKKDVYSLQELSEVLSISEATAWNWLKTGKIRPDRKLSGKHGFSAKAVEKIQESLQDEKNTRLRSRRNKSHIQGSDTYQNYLPETSANLLPVRQIQEEFREGNVTEDDMTALLADCALQLLRQAKGTDDIGDCLELVEDLRNGQAGDNTKLPKVQYVLEPGMDVLGFLYLSLRHAGEMKLTGAYYTPTFVVKKAVKSLEESGKLESGKRVLDPCCGSGNFLIQFPKNVNPQDIYGSDIDGISVKLTRINLAIRYPKVPAAVWKEHITRKDFLMEETEEAYDCILGNPPWGYRFSVAEQEKLEERYLTARRRKTESYDVFLEQALRSVRKAGTVSFVLPEAMLYVNSHEKIRELLLQKTDIEELNYLGDVFHKVQCPSVILRLKKTEEAMQTKGMKVEYKEEAFSVNEERRVEKEGFYFHVKDEEYRILQKLEQNPDMEYLKNHADFALGIVTGDNRKYVTDRRRAGAEVVLKGADIGRYRITKPKRYLVFQPERFQQTASEEYYRSPNKLLYRFVSRELIFARDTEGTLSLNSCNIVIPHLEGYSTEYILAVLNSSMAKFVFQKKFHSVKVLRSHIEQLPIPPATKEQQREIAEMVKKIENSISEEQWNSLYEEINKTIAKLAGLTKNEYEMITQKP